MSCEKSNRMIDNEYKKKFYEKKNTMFVVKRSGELEPVFFDKITLRNEKLCEDLDIDTRKVSQKVIDSMKSGMKTRELDILSAETALYMSTDCPEYEIQFFYKATMFVRVTSAQKCLEPISFSGRI